MSIRLSFSILICFLVLQLTTAQWGYYQNAYGPQRYYSSYYSYPSYSGYSNNYMGGYQYPSYSGYGYQNNYMSYPYSGYSNNYMGSYPYSGYSSSYPYSGYSNNYYSNSMMGVDNPMSSYRGGNGLANMWLVCSTCTRG